MIHGNATKYGQMMLLCRTIKIRSAVELMALFIKLKLRKAFGMNYLSLCKFAISQMKIEYLLQYLRLFFRFVL